MKTAIFSILLTLLLGCQKNETNPTYDFKVLGIEKIIINGNTEITLDAEGIPEKKGNIFLWLA